MEKSLDTQTLKGKPNLSPTVMHKEIMADQL